MPSDDALRFFVDRKRHLVCVPYSIENLHRMARELGIGRHWYHGGKFPHYDVPKSRVAEIQTRCTVVRSREILQIIKGS